MPDSEVLCATDVGHGAVAVWSVQFIWQRLSDRIDFLFAHTLSVSQVVCQPLVNENSLYLFEPSLLGLSLLNSQNLKTPWPCYAAWAVHCSLRSLQGQSERSVWAACQRRLYRLCSAHLLPFFFSFPQMKPIKTLQDNCDRWHQSLHSAVNHTKRHTML